MARVDIHYNNTTHKINVVVAHKRSKTIVSSTDSSTEAYGTAKFLTRVFHEITMDTMNECHKKALKVIEDMQREPNPIS